MQPAICMAVVCIHVYKVHSAVQTLSAAVFQGSGRPNLSGHLGTADASLNGADKAQGATKSKLYLTTRAVAGIVSP